jgi:hypothetical protein
MEFGHVIVYEYNMMGHQTSDADHPQEHNLLYIALTRSTDRITFLMNRRTQRVPSPFLPVELVHYATELWSAET